VDAATTMWRLQIRRSHDGQVARLSVPHILHGSGMAPGDDMGSRAAVVQHKTRTACGGGATAAGRAATGRRGMSRHLHGALEVVGESSDGCPAREGQANP
jgi:hypothetical protein